MVSYSGRSPRLRLRDLRSTSSLHSLHRGDGEEPGEQTIRKYPERANIRESGGIWDRKLYRRSLDPDLLAQTHPYFSWSWHYSNVVTLSNWGGGEAGILIKALHAFGKVRNNSWRAKAHLPLQPNSCRINPARLPKHEELPVPQANRVISEITVFSPAEPTFTKTQGFD